MLIHVQSNSCSSINSRVPPRHLCVSSSKRKTWRMRVRSCVNVIRKDPRRIRLGMRSTKYLRSEKRKNCCHFFFRFHDSLAERILKKKHMYIYITARTTSFRIIKISRFDGTTIKIQTYNNSQRLVFYSFDMNNILYVLLLGICQKIVLKRFCHTYAADSLFPMDARLPPRLQSFITVTFLGVYNKFVSKCKSAYHFPRQRRARHSIHKIIHTTLTNKYRILTH